MRALLSFQSEEIVENTVFTPIWTNKVVKFDIKRLGQRKASSIGLVVAIMRRSTIDLLAAPVKDILHGRFGGCETLRTPIFRLVALSRKLIIQYISSQRLLVNSLMGVIADQTKETNTCFASRL